MNLSPQAAAHLRRARRRKLTLALAVLALIVIIVVLVYYAPNEVNEIEFVIANGYTGPVIVEQSPDGAALEHVPEEKKYIVRVGGSGRVQLQDTTPLETWHRVNIHYANGAAIPVRRLGKQPDETFGWWEGFATDRAEFVSYIGTLQDARAFYDNR